MATLAPERQISFVRGMQDSAASTAYGLDECKLLRNFRVTPDGRAQVRYGTQRTHASELNGGAQGYGFVQFTLTDGSVQWVAFVGDTMQYSDDDGVTWTEGASGLTEDYWDFATLTVGGTNYLLAANGATNSYSWDGSTWTTITDIPANVFLLTTQNDRLWASDGKKLYASKIENFNVWASPDGIVLPINTHDGDRITGLFSLGSMIVAFKRRSTAYVQGYGNSDVITRSGTQGLFRSIGCIAYRSIAAVGDDGMIWLSERGFEWYVPGMAQPTLVSASMQSFMQTIAWTTIQADPGVPSGVYSPRNLTYECEIPSSGSENNITFAYRMPFGGRPGAPFQITRQTSVSTADTLTVDADGYLDIVTGTGGSLAILVDGYLDLSTDETGSYVSIDADGYLDLELVVQNPAALALVDTDDQTAVVASIGYDGFVRLHDTGPVDDLLSDGTGGVPIDAVLQTRPFVFGDPFTEKKARQLKVLAANGTATTLSASVESDPSSSSSHVLAIDAGTDHPRATRCALVARGHDLGIEITASTAGLLISGVELKAEYLEERAA